MFAARHRHRLAVQHRHRRVAQRLPRFAAHRLRGWTAVLSQLAAHLLAEFVRAAVSRDVDCSRACGDVAAVCSTPATEKLEGQEPLISAVLFISSPDVFDDVEEDRVRRRGISKKTFGGVVLEYLKPACRRHSPKVRCPSACPQRPPQDANSEPRRLSLATRCNSKREWPFRHYDFDPAQKLPAVNGQRSRSVDYAWSVRRYLCAPCRQHRF